MSNIIRTKVTIISQNEEVNKRGNLESKRQVSKDV